MRNSEKFGIITDFLVDSKMTILFIADLHLSQQIPQTVELFQRFLQEQASQAEALYILGDLFEAWVGDDVRDPTVNIVRDALKKLSENIPIYIVSGNRDFLLDKRFAKSAGCTLLTEPITIDLYGTLTLLVHGDTLCTLDTRYQRWRKISHQRWLQWCFLALPLWLREKIAASLRQKSRQHVRQISSDIMDVTPEAVREVMQNHRVTQLIHGHTHRPGIEHFPLGDSVGYRYTLGDWHETGSALAFSRENPPKLFSFS